MGDFVMETILGVRGMTVNRSVFIPPSSYLNLVLGYHLNITASLGSI